MMIEYPGVRRGVLALGGLVAVVSVPLLLSPAAARFRTAHIAAAVQSYAQENLVSDTPDAKAKRIDANLVNPWGIVPVPGGPIWIADNGTGVATVYLGNGMPGPSPDKPLVVTIPPPPGGSPPAAPTGMVFNDSSDFDLGNGNPARFLFATEDGTISGWNPKADATHAVLKVDNSASAVYKGLARLGSHLYATNFKANSVDVFNSDFSSAGSFTDTDVPLGFAPFGIQNLGGTLFVTYAKQNDEKHDDVKGPGNGFVDIFNPDSHQFSRFASAGALNSPWALALAPVGFGPFSNMLLVGNFGDGRINAFNPANETFLGQISDSSGTTISIEGLWGLSFGIDPDDPATPSLFFTAGIGGEKHGLFGRLRVAAP